MKNDREIFYKAQKQIKKTNLKNNDIKNRYIALKLAVLHLKDKTLFEIEEIKLLEIQEIIKLETGLELSIFLLI